MTIVAQRIPEPASPTPQVSPRWRREWIFGLVVATSALWALTLNNGAFTDEALYVDVGRAYLGHWFDGVPLPDGIGAGVAGMPQLYPVLAGLLDMVGGLELVRLFSVVCLVATVVLVSDLTARMFGARAGLLAAALFGFSGPVMHVGHLATYDAVVILLLAVALRSAFAKPDHRNAVLLGLTLAVAAAVSLAATVLVVPVLLFWLSDPARFRPPSPGVVRRRSEPRFRLRLALLAGGVVVVVLAGMLLAAGDVGREVARAATDDRSVASSPSPGHLLGVVADFTWPVLLSGAVGAALLVRARGRSAVLATVSLVVAALVLPAVQVVTGPDGSFHQDLAYLALFLAPLGGFALERIWSYSYSLVAVPVTLFLVTVFLVGAFRAHDLIEYPDVRPVVDGVELADGEYLSSSPGAMSYYTLHDDIVWVGTVDLIAAGEPETAEAVDEERFERVLLHVGAAGDVREDADHRALLRMLEDSDYTRTSVGEDQEWLVYTRSATHRHRLSPAPGG